MRCRPAHLAGHEHELVLLVGDGVDVHSRQARLDVLRIVRDLGHQLWLQPSRSGCERSQRQGLQWRAALMRAQLRGRRRTACLAESLCEMGKEGEGGTAKAVGRGCCCKWRACACAARPGTLASVLRRRPESDATLCHRWPTSWLSCSVAFCQDRIRWPHPSRSLSGRAAVGGLLSCMLQRCEVDRLNSQQAPTDRGLLPCWCALCWLWERPKLLLT